MSKELVKIGEISHYYTDIEVAVVELVDELRINDKVMIRGATTDFTQLVKSMEIERDPVTEAKVGDSIGLAVQNRVRSGDQVFKV